MRINLWYLSPNPFGGWVTFTRHLYKTLEQCGHEVHLYKWSLSGNDERFKRPFGYDLMYRNTSIFPKQGANLIVAMGKNYLQQAKAMVQQGAMILVHDPTELKWKEGIDHGTGAKCIVGRRSMLRHLPDATWIRYPYVPHFRVNSPIVWVDMGVSLSRIDFDKHTEILLEANRLLEDDNHKIRIRGFENRIFTRFNILPKYPEWKQSVSHWPREHDGAVLMAHRFRYMVDMSEIKGDGGGTQYSFLEAWDAGCVPVLSHKWWPITLHKDYWDMVPGQNCRKISSPQELAKLMLGGAPLRNDKQIVVAGRRQLHSQHDPMLIGAEYATALS